MHAGAPGHGCHRRQNAVHQPDREIKDRWGRPLADTRASPAVQSVPSAVKALCAHLEEYGKFLTSSVRSLRATVFLEAAFPDAAAAASSLVTSTPAAGRGTMYHKVGVSACEPVSLAICLCTQAAGDVQATLCRLAQGVRA